MTNRIGKITTAAVVAVATAAMGLGALVAPAAFAAEGNIDSNQKGTLVIHKRAKTSDNGSATGDGTEQTVTGDPVAGVTFRISKVNGVNLTAASDWGSFQSLGPSSVHGTDPNRTVTIGSGTTAQTKTLQSNEDAQTVTTDDQGNATLSGLDLGLYYVEETDPGKNLITAPAEPFFVTLPFPSKNAWLYQVHVYPKNSLGTTTKDVDPSPYHKVGDDIKWNVDQRVPGVEEGKHRTAFGIHDVLDSHLTYQSVKVTQHNVANNTDDQTFEEGTDYTVTRDPADNPRALFIQFTETGLGKLTDNTVIRYAITTKVDSVPPVGMIDNGVWPLSNDYNPWNEDKDNPPVHTTNEPYFGNLTINKTDESGHKLGGAIFKLWPTSGDEASCKVSDVPDNALEATSNDTTGVASFTDVLLGKFLRGTEASSVHANFCLRETQAPAGYVTPGNDATKFVTLTAGQDHAEHLDIENTKQNGPKLPLTGAAGAVVLTVAAVALIALAGGLYVVNRRRQSAR